MTMTLAGWFGFNSINQTPPQLTNKMSNSEFEHCVKKINVEDDAQVSKLASIVKINLDVFIDLAKTYAHQYVKLSLNKATMQFVPDTDFLYTRRMAGNLPDFVRWSDSNIQNIYGFFEFLILRINVLGKYKINHQHGSLARYFWVHKLEIKAGLDRLIKTYSEDGFPAKKHQIDVLTKCARLLDPLDAAIDGLFNPNNEEVAIWSNGSLYIPKDFLNELLSLEPFVEISRFLEKMKWTYQFPSKWEFLLFCLRAGVEKVTPFIHELNVSFEEHDPQTTWRTMESYNAQKIVCKKILENKDFEPLHKLIYSALTHIEESLCDLYAKRLLKVS